MTSPSTEGTASVTAPPTWTTDPDYLDSASMWAAKGIGTMMAKQHQLATPLISIMCTTPDTGEIILMFSSAGSVHVWNIVADTVYKVVKPASQDEIIASMQKNNGNMAQLGVEEVLPVVPLGAK